MCKSSESGKHVSQSRDWKASDVIGAERICRGQSWWVSFTQRGTSWGPSSHYILGYVHHGGSGLGYLSLD